MAANRQLFSMMERVYALALLQEAAKIDAVEEIFQESKQILAMLRAQPDVLRLMQSRTLGKQKRAAALERIFKGRIHDLLYRFFRVLVERDRFDELPGIGLAFLALYEEKHGVVEAEAHVAEALDEATAGRVAERLGRSLNRKIALSQKIDPALIGGLKLRVGDEIIDGSVATQLRRVREQLVEAAREKARTNFSRFVKE